MGFQSHWAYQEIEMSQNSIYPLTLHHSMIPALGGFTSAQSLCLWLPENGVSVSLKQSHPD